MPACFHVADDIEVRQNLIITARERGKIVERREGHNIWLNLGREYLASLISYLSFSPDTPERDDRIKYMGFGIGGVRQLVTPVPAPVDTAYPGTNVQTDTDPSVTTLERPVRVTGGSTVTPGAAGDEWIGLIQAPAVHSLPTEVTFKRLFGQLEISYVPFLSVPLSEIGLLTAAADPENFANNLVAYDTFDTVSKTSAFELEVEWTIRF
jgi:hypothetical protein